MPSLPALPPLFTFKGKERLGQLAFMADNSGPTTPRRRPRRRADSESPQQPAGPESPQQQTGGLHQRGATALQSLNKSSSLRPRWSTQRGSSTRQGEELAAPREPALDHRPSVPAQFWASVRSLLGLSSDRYFLSSAQQPPATCDEHALTHLNRYRSVASQGTRWLRVRHCR